MYAKLKSHSWWHLLNASFDTPTFYTILTDKNYAKFGDSIVNFIYNAAIYESSKIMGGIKVWDKCLAFACKNSPLKSFIGRKKDSGELGDTVEAFIGYIYSKDRTMLDKMVNILSNFLKQKLILKEKDEIKICSEAFAHLLQTLCKSLDIS